MGRYRKTDPRMYGDERFRSLSKPQPNGQTLFHYLFTGPHTTNLPGLSLVGMAQLSEALGWSISGCRAAWATVCRAGLAEADWEARVLWVPNVIKYDPPESPSVVKSWANPLGEIPECALKAKACQQLTAWLTACGPAWAAAWPTGSAQGVPQGVPHPEPTPEPEPEPVTPPTPSRGARASEDEFLQFASRYPAHRFEDTPTARKEFRKARKEVSLADMAAALERDKASDAWLAEKGRYVPHPTKWLRRHRWKMPEGGNNGALKWEPPQVRGARGETDGLAGWFNPKHGEEEAKKLP